MHDGRTIVVPTLITIIAFPVVGVGCGGPESATLTASFLKLKR